MDDFPDFMKRPANKIATSSHYTLIIDDQRIPVRAGEEYFIRKGTRHGGEPVAGTRTIHAFGARRAERTHR
jgi:hypothetical protein